MNRIFLFLWSLFFIIIVSCNSGARRSGIWSKDGNASTKNSNNLDSDKTYHFKLHLITGTKYYYTINTETLTKLEVNGKKVETGGESKLGLIYEIIKDSSGIFFIKIIYDKLHIVIKKDGTEDQVLDADNDPSQMSKTEKILVAIKGSSLILTLNSKGDILNITGSKEISDKVMAGMGGDDLDTKKRMQELVSKLSGSGFVEDNLKQGFKLFPDNTLYEGDNWTQKNTQSSDISFDVNSKYTLSSLGDGIAEVSTEGQISNNKGSKIMGYDVTTDLDGNQSGEFKADMNTGILLYGKSNTSITGTIQVAGKDVPVEINIEKEITAKKVQ